MPHWCQYALLGSDERSFDGEIRTLASKNSTGYDADSIQTLEGLEAVR